MSLGIARNADSRKRIFPSPSPSLYRAPEDAPDIAPEQRAARRVLGLGNRSLSRWQRLGLRLDSLGPVSRLLYFHKSGLETELVGKARRADFFWEEVRKTVRSLRANHPVWVELARAFGTDTTWASDPGQVRLALVREVLLDTHIAFYNGAPEPAAGRALTHLAHLRALLPAAELSEEDRLALLGPPTEVRLKALCDAKRYEQAIHVAQEVYAEFPEHQPFQDSLAQLHFSAALEESPRTDEGPLLRAHAARLQVHINQVERLRRQCPFNLACYESLAHLHHIQAIKLANGDRPSQALLALEKALTYKPGWSDAQEAQTKIVTLLKQLLENMETVDSSETDRRFPGHAGPVGGACLSRGVAEAAQHTAMAWSSRQGLPDRLQPSRFAVRANCQQDIRLIEERNREGRSPGQHHFRDVYHLVE